MRDKTLSHKTCSSRYVYLCTPGWCHQVKQHLHLLVIYALLLIKGAQRFMPSLYDVYETNA